MKKTMRVLMASAILMSGIGGLTSCQQDNFNGLTINFWHTFGKTVADGVAKYARQFAKIVKEQDDVDIRIKMTYKSGYDTIKGDIQKSFATSGNPTIAVAYPDHIADYFASEKYDGEYVANLQPFAESTEYGFNTEEVYGDKHGSDDFVEAFWEESNNYNKDGIYSLPFLKSTESMLYNFDIVKKAMPMWDPSYTTDDAIKEKMKDISWEELMEFAEFIVDHKSDINNKIKWPVYYDSDSNLVISNLAQNDIPYSGIDDKGNGYIGFNKDAKGATPDQIQAYDDVYDQLERYKGWYDQGLFCTKGVNTKYSSSYFTLQQTVFAIGSTGGSGYSFPSAKWNIECVKVPYFNGKPVYVSQGPTLTLLHNNKLRAAGTDDQAVLYGWKFMKYMTNEEVNATMCVNNSEGYMPVRNSAYQTATFRNFIGKTGNAYVKVAKVVVEDIDGAYLSTAVFKGSAALRDAVGAMFADTMKLAKNPGESAIKAEIDKAIDAATKRM